MDELELDVLLDEAEPDELLPDTSWNSIQLIFQPSLKDFMRICCGPAWRLACCVTVAHVCHPQVGVNSTV